MKTPAEFETERQAKETAVEDEVRSVSITKQRQHKLAFFLFVHPTTADEERPGLSNPPTCQSCPVQGLSKTIGKHPIRLSSGNWLSVESSR